MQTVQKYSQEVPNQYTKSAGKTKASESIAQTGVNLNTKAMDKTQQDKLGTTSENGEMASTGLKASSEAAAELGRVAGECKTAMESKCKNLDQADNAKAQKVVDACDKIAKNAVKTAAEKAGGGMDMASLAQLAGAAMQAMAAMKPSPKPESSSGLSTPSSSDYGNNSTTPENASGSSIDNTPGAGSTSIGSTNPNTGGSMIGNTKSNPSGSTFTAGSGPGYGGFNAASMAPELAESLGGTSADSNEGLAGGGSMAASGGASGSGGGGGGSDSSGASKMAEDAAKAAAAAAAAEAAYELPAGGGGGGGRPAFLGLKASSSEGEGEGEGSGDGVLGELGLDEEGGRELASDESQGDGISADDGVSLFKVIHTKYADIKKRGNI